MAIDWDALERLSRQLRVRALAGAPDELMPLTREEVALLAWSAGYCVRVARRMTQESQDFRRDFM